MELPERGMGAALLRELAAGAEVATVGTYEKFARMMDRHWDGSAAHCQPQHKVPLGFGEGVNNKLRVRQRRTYGLHEEDYLRLKILTCMLPEI